jgi:hypothetical protein
MNVALDRYVGVGEGAVLSDALCNLGCETVSLARVGAGPDGGDWIVQVGGQI